MPRQDSIIEVELEAETQVWACFAHVVGNKDQLTGSHRSLPFIL